MKYGASTQINNSAVRTMEGAANGITHAFGARKIYRRSFELLFNSRGTSNKTPT
ncbi:MAG: hypothetical protein LBP35_04040 [Candidatus Ancillula trichonymphae]|nr:hypothetical protein [Candidatus Ancillula trichonymphae]